MNFSFPPFLYLPLVAGLGASLTSGIIGTYVVTRRIVFISGSISHAVLGGMGFFLFLQRTYNLTFLSPLQGALLSAIGAAVILGWTHVRFQEREDSIIAALWAVGMSLGVLFITLTPGYNVELMNFLFGNILWASPADIYTIFTLDALILLAVLLGYRKFQAICFDEKQATIQGLSTKKIYIFLLCLIALSIVVLIQVVGAILVIALLTMPAAIASSYTRTLASMMQLATACALFCTYVGLHLSYLVNWPSGAVITLLTALVYTLSLLHSCKTKRKN